MIETRSTEIQIIILEAHEDAATARSGEISEGSDVRVCVRDSDGDDLLAARGVTMSVRVDAEDKICSYGIGSRGGQPSLAKKR